MQRHTLNPSPSWPPPGAPHPRRARGRLLDETGQALAEFAVVGLFVMLPVLFAIVQFGLSFNAANNQTNVASEIARYAIVNENPGKASKETLQQWGKQQLYTNYNNALNNEGKVCIEFPNGKAEVGEPVKVTVTSKTNWIPILKLPVSETEVKGTAFMRLEATPSAEVFTAGCTK